MSRGRGAHAAPQGDAGAEARRAEREEIRQLTRELHEAAQAALAAAKDLRSARAEAWTDTEAMLTELTAESRGALQGWIDHHMANISDNHQRIGASVLDLERVIQEKFAGLAGHATAEAFREALDDSIAKFVAAELHEHRYMDTIAQIIIKALDMQTGGGLTKTAMLQGRIVEQAGGQVTVDRFLG